ncbi:MAG TPA: GFA family protein [Rhizomicrobium sp.]|nr:GFA family protein [Rhizomicrobium sp.]
MADELTGSCFCGEVQYTLADRPMWTQCCHCTDCQKQTGSAFAINAMIEASNVTVTKGEPAVLTLPTDSGRPHDVYHCAKCQSALWSDYGRRGYLYFLRVATLDGDHGIVPDAHIFTKSKVAWVRLPEDVRAFEVYYDMKKEWPAASLARREAMIAAAKAK